MPELKNKKYELFAQAIAKGEKQNKSYGLAGYSVDGKTPKSINECACRLAKNKNVVARVKELLSISSVETQKEFNCSLTNSLKLDYEIVDRYKKYMAVLENRMSTKEETEIAIRILKFVPVSAYSAAQDRIAKKQGYYREEAAIIQVNGEKVVFEIPARK